MMHRNSSHRFQATGPAARHAVRSERCSFLCPAFVSPGEKPADVCFRMNVLPERQPPAAAAAIFSIPIIYYTFRKIQKSLAFKRNVKAELKRQYKSISASLVKDKERLKRLESFEEFPEDLKNSIIDLNKKGIDASEKRLEKLKNRI